ncbi:unnamed protein product [Rhizophagus irregularis]|nr:unnamed protein product [Rhizophagus irregularis]
MICTNNLNFKNKTILADELLTKDEKSEAIRILTANYDRGKLVYNKGTRRVCENCNQNCLATLYCEYCVRNYLKNNFSNWTSGNDDIDNLIQECQMKTFDPNVIIEWIPYDNLKNTKYLTKGGYSEIYTAEWYVVLKRLENVESANKRWFEEANSHLNICNKWSDAIVKCVGLTKDPLNGDYMLVMNKLDADLRKYLQQNHNQLTWKERIQMADSIIMALSRVHKENAIHRDLHSGNILFQSGGIFNISDLGFCGPADKPLKSVYGNLPYIAPEVIAGKLTTFKSDIYSIGILMWEISSGQPPFINCEHDYNLAMNIVNGIRPKIVSGTPLEYKTLMIRCWDANPSNRPDIKTLRKRIRELNLDYQNKPNELLTQMEEDNSSEISGLENYTNSSRCFTSKVHKFENLPEPRNATEEEQEVDDFDKLNNQKNGSKIISIFKVGSKKLSKIFKKNSKNGK